MTTENPQLVRFSIGDEHTLPGARNAALSLRSKIFESSEGNRHELIVGHCAVMGIINEETQNAKINFYVGVDPEPAKVDSRALVLGIYRMPEFNGTHIMEFVRGGLSKTVKQSLGIINYCSDAISLQTINSDETDKARQHWRQLLVGDYLNFTGRIQRQSRNLLHPDNAEGVSEAALYYTIRSKNRYSEATQAIVAKALEIKELQIA